MKTAHLPAMNLALRSDPVLLLICGFCVLLGSFSPGTAEAAFYKCLDSDGGVTYSTSACPADEQVAKIIEGGASRAALDCRIARNFTRQVAPMVTNGESPETAFGRYGGINALSPTAIGLINYLYSFKGIPDTSAARISNLAVSRCENGSFGPADCAQFPPGFIDELGGCEGAVVPGGTRQDAASSRSRYHDPGYANARQAHSPSAARPDYRRQPQQQQLTEVATCRSRLKEKIDKVNQKMRNGTSSSQQDKLRAERHTLGRKLNRCRQ